MAILCDDKNSPIIMSKYGLFHHFYISFLVVKIINSTRIIWCPNTQATTDCVPFGITGTHTNTSPCVTDKRLFHISYHQSSMHSDSSYPRRSKLFAAVDSSQLTEHILSRLCGTSGVFTQPESMGFFRLYFKIENF